MQEEIAVIIGAVAIITIVGVLLVSLPITRRLGVALEEWIRIRAEGSADQAQIDQVVYDVRSLSRRIEALEDRLQLLSERQDFTESLVDSSSESRSIPSGRL